MKISALSLLLLAGSTSAQYFSAGWSPGQKAPASEPEVAPFIPGQSMEGDTSGHVGGPADAVPPPAAEAAKPLSLSSLFDMKNLLTSGPAVALFNRFGVNITQRVQDQLWDERVQLITDDNYRDVIVNEEMTPEEEKERLWVIIVSAQNAKQDEINKIIDNVFDSAFNKSQIAGDLPNVRWGRIDYLNVTYLTTKWSIWRAPYLIILTDRGQTLWFYHHYQLRFREENLLHFLKEKQYLLSPPWSTSFAPGGEHEYIMDFAATWITKLYNVTTIIPNWLLLIISGGIGSLLIGLLHRPSKNTEIKNQPSQTQAKPAGSTEKPKVEEKKAQSQAQPQVQKQSSKQKGKQREVVPPAPIPASTPAATPSPSAAAQTKPTTAALASAKPPSPKPAPASAVPVLPKPAIATPGTTDSERESSVPPTSAKRTARQRKNNKKA